MGHLAGKDLFRQLGRRIDGMEMRAPWNDQLYAILRELYTAEEAALVARMPFGLAGLEELVAATGYAEADLRRLLDGLTGKGLVMDLWIGDGYRYAPSPMVIGIFEFTMMRVGPNADSKAWAGLFRDYMEGDQAFLETNFGHGEQVSFIRALPWEGAVPAEDYVEILDYEKASALLEESERFAIGICSCRHEQLHLGEKTCDAPLETCSQFGLAAEFMIRHNLAREVGREEMRDNFARSQELGLVLAADNVRKNMKFVCHCCGCCCNVLRAVSRYGYPNILVTSTLLAGVDAESCLGCGKCARACPIEAISMVAGEPNGGKPGKRPVIDTDLCLGCGVCALQCPPRACRLEKRRQRVLHPETTFHRVILQALEKGTLHNQIFATPQRFDQKFMRALVGGFLRLPPVKRALMSDTLRSRFLRAMEKGVSAQGKGWVTAM